MDDMLAVGFLFLAWALLMVIVVIDTIIYTGKAAFRRRALKPVYAAARAALTRAETGAAGPDDASCGGILDDGKW